MSEIKRQHELSDVYAAFGERCPSGFLLPKKYQPKENLDIDKKSLVAEMQGFGEASAEDFDSIKKGHPDAVKTDTDEISVESITYYAQQSTVNPDVSFSVQKRFFKETVSEGKEPFFRKPYKGEMEMVSFGINKRNKDYQIRVGNMDLVWEKDGKWNLSDRFMDKRFRGQGVAKALLGAAESFVQKYADKTKTPQTVSLELSQPSVLVTFLNAGYTAETEEDQKRIDAILSGAEELFKFPLFTFR